jgi:hypothetical protein
MYRSRNFRVKGADTTESALRWWLVQAACHAFVILLVFATTVYPHIKASWGGGMPENVTVYFTKDSLINPSKAVQAQLIEEADEGFYILGPKESKAIFIPRGSVALVYFSDKTSDSPILQGIK